jgi:hypothetical protein
VERFVMPAAWTLVALELVGEVAETRDAPTSALPEPETPPPRGA